MMEKKRESKRLFMTIYAVHEKKRKTKYCRNSASGFTCQLHISIYYLYLLFILRSLSFAIFYRFLYFFFFSEIFSFFFFKFLVDVYISSQRKGIFIMIFLL